MIRETESMQNREPREISVEGLTPVAGGVHGTVYLYDEERIVKLYCPEISREETEKEQRLAREAFIIGVPGAITFETVRCGNRYGIIYEKIRSDTLGHAIASAPEKLEAYAARYAELARKLHGIRTTDPLFPELKAELRRRLPLLGDFCTDSDLALLEDLTGCIPTSDSLIHGDLHPGNVMIQDGELLLIDMPDLMRGSPVWDLAAVYRDLIIGPMNPSPELEKSIGMKAELIARTGQAFFRAYTGLEGKALEAWLQGLLPLYGMNTAFTLAGAADRNRDVCAAVIPMLMREAVRKHEDSLRKTLAEYGKGA